MFACNALPTWNRTLARFVNHYLLCLSICSITLACFCQSLLSLPLLSTPSTFVSYLSNTDLVIADLALKDDGSGGGAAAAAAPATAEAAADAAEIAKMTAAGLAAAENSGKAVPAATDDKAAAAASAAAAAPEAAAPAAATTSATDDEGDKEVDQVGSITLACVNHYLLLLSLPNAHSLFFLLYLTLPGRCSGGRQGCVVAAINHVHASFADGGAHVRTRHVRRRGGADGAVRWRCFLKF
jgi:hypothetical protein